MTLGQHDDELFQYEIADGLSKYDMITYPEDGLKEGMKTAVGSNGQMGQSNPVTDGEDMDFSNEDYSEEENSGSDLSDENGWSGFRRDESGRSHRRRDAAE